MLMLICTGALAQVTTQEALNAAISAATPGSTVEISAAGTYKVPGISKNITVKGTVDGVVFDCVGSGSIASIPNGCTFENVKFEMGTSDYHGFQQAGTINMNGCTINGKFFSYGDMNFTGCTFNQTASDYSMWDYGKDLTYTNCTFNCNGKFINVYNEGNGDWKLKVERCTFNSTMKNKAALNIKASCGAKVLGWDVTINNCTVNDEAMFPSASGDATSALYVGSPIWQVDDRTAAALEANIVKVTLDGKVVYGGVAPDLTITTVEDLIAFEQAVNAGNTYDGKLVVLNNDIDLAGVNWKPIGNVTSYPGITFAGTFDGQNHTISNMTTSDNLANYATAGFFGSSKGTIKNLTLTNVKVNSTHYAGAICGYTSNELKIENCKVNGGTITSTPELIGSEYDNGDKVGGILGYGVAAASISGCAVEDLTITAHRDLGGIAGYMPGLVSNCSVKNTTIVQSYKNGYKTNVTTYAEIVGRDANANNTDNTSENVELKSVTGADPVIIDVPEEVEVNVPETATEEEKEAAKEAVEELGTNTAITTDDATNVAEVENVTTLKIEVKSVTVETATTEGVATAAVTKVTYDVQPMNGETEVNETAQPITFRLPVPQNFTTEKVKVSHTHNNITTASMVAVQGTGANKYVELSSDKFSEFSIEPLTVEPTGKIYAGTAAPIENQTFAQFATIRNSKPNAIMIVGAEFADYAQTETNVVVDYAVGNNGGHYYECPKFVLTDRASGKTVDFYTPVDFTAVTGSYSRNIYLNTNSCSLPFEIDNSMFENSGAKILTFAFLEAVGNTGMYAYFNAVESLTAGVPCFIYSTVDTKLNVTFNNTQIVAKPINENNIKGTFVSTTEWTSVPLMYGLTSNGDKLALVTTKIGALRSVLSMSGAESFNGGSNHPSTNEARVNELEIAIIGEDGVITGIDGIEIDNVVPENAKTEAVYNLNGQRVSKATKGLYIINGKKTIVK